MKSLAVSSKNGNAKTQTSQAWPFLICRHALWGMVTLAAPGFVIEAGLADQLAFRTQAAQTGQPRYLLLPGTAAGDLSVVYGALPVTGLGNGAHSAAWIVGLVFRNGDLVFIEQADLGQILQMLVQTTNLTLHSRSLAPARRSLPVEIRQENGSTRLYQPVAAGE